jgi:hypothetical protein
MAQQPATPLRDYYDALHLLKEQEQTALAEAHAEDASLLATRFQKSVETLATRDSIGETFYPPGRKDPLSVAPPGEIKSTFDFVARLVRQNGTVKGADHLSFEYVDREIFPTRTTAGTPSTRQQRRSLDLLLANANDRTPIFAELKIHGDRLPYFALIQALMLTSEFLAAPQRDRLGTDTPGLVWPASPPFADMYVIAYEAPERGRYRPRSLRATERICERLMSSGYVPEQVRRLAYLNASSGTASLEFECAFAFGQDA